MLCDLFAIFFYFYNHSTYTQIILTESIITFRKNAVQHKCICVCIWLNCYSQQINKEYSQGYLKKNFNECVSLIKFSLTMYHYYLIDMHTMKEGFAIKNTWSSQTSSWDNEYLLYYFIYLEWNLKKKRIREL